MAEYEPYISVIHLLIKSENKPTIALNYRMELSELFS